MTEIHKRLREKLLGKLVRCTNPDLTMDGSIGLITKIEPFGDSDLVYRIWSLWSKDLVEDLGWGKGVLWHDQYRFSKLFEVIQ